MPPDFPIWFLAAFDLENCFLLPRRTCSSWLPPHPQTGLRWHRHVLSPLPVFLSHLTVLIPDSQLTLRFRTPPPAFMSICVCVFLNVRSSAHFKTPETFLIVIVIITLFLLLQGCLLFYFARKISGQPKRPSSAALKYLKMIRNKTVFSFFVKWLSGMA